MGKTLAFFGEFWQKTRCSIGTADFGSETEVRRLQ
jgi:hypothetical protein